MSDKGSIIWSLKPEEFRGDIAATVAVDCRRWQDHGAHFAELDDGDGESVGLAAATLKSHSPAIDFGVLSYGEPDTFLLLDVSRGRGDLLIRDVLDALERQGILSWEEVLDVPQEIPAETLVAEDITARKKSAAKVEKGTRGRRTDRAVPKNLVHRARKKSLKGKVVAFDADTGYVVVRPDDGSGEIAVTRRQVVARTKMYELPVGTAVKISRGGSKHGRVEKTKRFKV